MKALNVLSLCDGMSCSQLALKKHKIGTYYASEIDKYAIQVTQKNFPDTVQLGSVTELSKKALKKLKIDILVGGSPCQGFSIAGKMKGSSTSCGIDVVSLKQYKKLKKDGFKFDGQSYLFWEFMRVLNIVKPKYFLLENVRVTQKWLPMFNKAMGVEPILINSNLVSAQNRPRYYWTNIANVKQPTDKGIVLRDILEDIPFNNVNGVANKYIVCENSNVTNIKKGSSGKSWFMEQQTYSPSSKKTRTLKSGSGSGNIPKVLDNDHLVFRKLTPLECERLQTVPDDYTKHVSNTQRYKMLGNGMTVEVMQHIFKGIK